MWAHRLTGPSRFEPVEIDPPKADALRDGEVLLRFRAAAICGSDMPMFLGKSDPAVPWLNEIGAPLHEVVADVVASKDGKLRAGDRVVGIAERHNGLQEYFVNGAHYLHSLNGSDLTDAEATVIQPLATVFNAIERIPSVRGKRVAVIGLGAIGMLFCHVFKSQGAKVVAGVDAVDRSAIARTFGIDEQVRSYSRDWADALGDLERPDVIVEAVGHQQATLVDAIRAVAPLGHIFAFGVPDEEFYAIPYLQLFRKNVTLHAGATTDWPRSLAESARYIDAHRDFLKAYITHVVPVSRAEEAFRIFAQPSASRLKVVLTES